MGFFKSIGNKLKRVVSIKNLVNGVTGNFSAIGSDVKRVMTTADPKKPVNTLTDVNFTVPQPVQDVLKTQDSLYKTNLVKSVASIPLVQDANTFMSKLWIQSQWLKYKNWIIGFLVVVLSFVLLRKFVFKKHSDGRKRK